MKDVLEYSQEDLEKLSDSELESLLLQAKMSESLYNTKQLVNKRLMNALYGALGNAAFPLFNEHMAAAITGNGRFFIQNLARFVENKLQSLIPSDVPYMIYGDTDSIYYHIEPFMKKIEEENPGMGIDFYVDKANEIEENIIQPTIVEAIGFFTERLNAYSPKSIWAEREIISDTAIFVAKKKYFARVRDSEGVRYPENDPYIKVMGLEIIKSSTPKWSQKYLKEAIPIFLDKTEKEGKEWLRQIKEKFMKSNLLDLSSISSVSSLEYRLGDKGLPIGARAALIHNKYVHDNKLLEKYDLIKSGDKTKRLFLRPENPFGSNIIAFTNDQFINEISEWVDYDEIWYKNFLKPLEMMAVSLNWDLLRNTEELDEW